MYLTKPGFLIGFHGCEKTTRDLIVSGQSMLKASGNGYDWLGEGFYFGKEIMKEHLILQ
jgi:hypothetical protein